MGEADKSGERKSIGEKTHISLRTAVLIMVVAVVPLTYFVSGMNWKIDSMIDAMKVREKTQDERDLRTDKRLDDHESRIRMVESHKP